jgi:hypothetical protein
MNDWIEDLFVILKWMRLSLKYKINHQSSAIPGLRAANIKEEIYVRILSIFQLNCNWLGWSKIQPLMPWNNCY